MARSPDQTSALASAPLQELQRSHPEAWAAVSEDLLAVLAKGRAEEVARWVERVRAEAGFWRARVRASGDNPAVVESALPHLVRERMARLALEKTTLAAAARQAEGKVRLGLWSGTLVQKLFFARDLERKPASLAAARLLWPLVPDRRLVMPLVQSRGIYCFYSRALVRELAALAAGRPCLELAAGDGTLSRFLAAAGVAVTATDDGSWSAVRPAPEVVRLDARAALRSRPAPVVLCSWPPAGNGFEAAVFSTPAVELYVVMASRHRFAAGDWASYERQATFDWSIDERLSRLVLPPELDPAVLVFRRRAGARS
ncbi:MAG: hypothetical protein ACJ79L_02075 [Anaeromyxobacteraceae bacterium]